MLRANCCDHSNLLATKVIVTKFSLNGQGIHIFLYHPVVGRWSQTSLQVFVIGPSHIQNGGKFHVACLAIRCQQYVNTGQDDFVPSCRYAF